MESADLAKREHRSLNKQIEFILEKFYPMRPTASRTNDAAKGATAKSEPARSVGGASAILPPKVAIHCRHWTMRLRCGTRRRG